MIKLGISGFCGKMGQRISALAIKDKSFKVVLGLERKDYPQVGQIVGGINISANQEDLKKCDCIIDFTVVSATLELLPYLVKYRKCTVIGTTGLDEAAQAKIKEAAKKIPIVFSPNMSIGVNLLFRLVGMSAKILQGYKVYIEEAHHIHKKDAPSGTAKKIAQIINQEGFNIKTEDVKAIREGEIVGDHRIVFESDVDKIELFHSAKTRDIFAKGALLAAKWIVGKKPGLYSMDDILLKA
ncbi:MAG: 4-hydroxy-tetrahydrodipicolinate reductase [Candidatus Omnitrophota bacterium]|nr:4-hydroxy-tetrahydrodipicolinate reductase [Candidatus Omnitrophota bacterium]